MQAGSFVYCLSSPSVTAGVELEGLKVLSSFPSSMILGSCPDFIRILNAFGSRLSSMMQCSSSSKDSGRGDPRSGDNTVFCGTVTSVLLKRTTP